MSDPKKGEEEGGKLDKILAHLADSATKQDAMTKRMDAMEESYSDSRKRMDSVCAKMDAAEEEKKADAAKADAAKADAAKADAAKADADEKAKMDAAKADAARKDAEDEEKKKADAAKADAARGVSHEDIEARIARAVAAAVPKPLADEERAKFVATQAKWETVAQAFGDQAQRFLDGETHDAYRRRLMGKYKPHSADWKDIDISPLSGKTLDVVEARIYTDAESAARHPTDLPANVLRQISRADQAGRTHISFVGSEKAAWAPFCNPERKGRINTRFERTS